MKKITLTIAFSFWLIVTLLLVCSIIGMLLFLGDGTYADRDNSRSTWMLIGKKIADELIA
jgi:hypothetical protein